MEAAEKHPQNDQAPVSSPKSAQPDDGLTPRERMKAAKEAKLREEEERLKQARVEAFKERQALEARKKALAEGKEAPEVDIRADNADAAPVKKEKKEGAKRPISNRKKNEEIEIDWCGMDIEAEPPVVAAAPPPLPPDEDDDDEPLPDVPSPNADEAENFEVNERREAKAVADFEGMVKAMTQILNLDDTLPPVPANEDIRGIGTSWHLEDEQPEDSMAYRIERLREELEETLGFDTFFGAYRVLQSLQEEENDADLRKALHGVLTEEQMPFVARIHYLIVCEESYYAEEED
eukprot:TRINITY_DN2281_c0_g1_i1.p1 TRINITY_DN2281_c0_g1~~TRINITY_DN2281_c0_g1_i1.p1  ORF type:complete len:292 (-),score=89.58 TRINITY_DN2281_c0_g1_i1:8-883(-)